jgi:hypothetical protein
MMLVAVKDHKPGLAAAGTMIVVNPMPITARVIMARNRITVASTAKARWSVNPRQLSIFRPLSTIAFCTQALARPTCNPVQLFSFNQVTTSPIRLLCAARQLYCACTAR